MSWRPPLPAFPPVPTAPMDFATQSELVAALLECKKASAWPDVRRYAKAGLARLWLHLVLDRGIDPRTAVLSNSKGHQAALRPYLDAGMKFGLGDRAELAWDVHEVASLAAELWDKAKKEQSASRASQAQLLGLEPNLATPATTQDVQ